MDGASETIDFWDVLDEAEEMVQRWPAWQQRIEGDVFSANTPALDDEWWPMLR
jgi:hypothetical protein